MSEYSPVRGKEKVRGRTGPEKVYETEFVGGVTETDRSQRSNQFSTELYKEGPSRVGGLEISINPREQYPGVTWKDGSMINIDI